eukprot:1195737-Prorocentrum_minimum.AAC.7
MCVLDDRSSTTACCYELENDDDNQNANANDNDNEGESDGENQQERLPTSTRPVIAAHRSGTYMVSTQDATTKRSKKGKNGNDSKKSSRTPCAICFDECKKTVLAPCGHKAICKGCTLKLLQGAEYPPKCPICRSEVQSFIEKEYRV